MRVRCATRFAAARPRLDGHGGSTIRSSHQTLRRLAALLLATCAALAPLSTPAFAATTTNPRISVPSALVMTMDGTVLWSHNPDAPRPVASTIKMLNALVVMDNAKMDDVVVVSRQAANVGGIGLVAGQKLTVRQLLTVMLVHSSNDAAEALAIHIGGTEKKYVAMMNAKAKALGLTHTRARDPHGLGKHERSTAADLSVLARHIMADPTLRGIVHRTSATIGSTRWGTTNALLGVYPGMEGVKTGYTDPAGYVFVGAARHGNVELLGVVMGASSNAGRFTAMRELLNWGFAHAGSIPPARRQVSLEATMGVVFVANGLEPTVTVHASKVATSLVFVGSAITTSVVLPQSVKAPVACGQQLGTLKVCRDGSTIATVALLADASVAAPPPPDAEALKLAHAPRPQSFWQRAVGAWAATWRRLLSGIALAGPAA